MNCCKCFKEICDPVYLLADNKKWHTSCLKCEMCNNLLANYKSMFFKNGMVLCKNDYYSMMTVPCSGCGNSLTPDCLALKIPITSINTFNGRNCSSNKWLVYHTSCLKCDKCKQFLNPGDKYVLKPDNQGVICLNNDCANDFRMTSMNSSMNQAPVLQNGGRKRGRQSANSSVKVKAEKMNQFNSM